MTRLSVIERASLFVMPLSTTMSTPWDALPPSSHARLQAIAHPTRQAQSAWARVLVLKALQTWGAHLLDWTESAPKPPVITIEHPHVEDIVQVVPSLAHTSTGIAVSLPAIVKTPSHTLTLPLFVDVERMQPRKTPFEHLIAHTWGKEAFVQAQLHTLTSDALCRRFYEWWGIHETVIKANYEGYHLESRVSPEGLLVMDSTLSRWHSTFTTLPQAQDTLLTILSHPLLTKESTKAWYATLSSLTLTKAPTQELFLSVWQPW